MDQVWRLRHFLAAAELGSLQAAARQLNTSQPALTKSLRELENFLGSALFERSSRGVVLTQAGQVLLSRAREIEAQWDGALIDLNATRDGARGELHIGVGPTYEAAFMPRVLSVLSSEFPNLRLTVRTGVGSVLLPKLVLGEIGLYIGGLRSVTDKPLEDVAEIPLYEQFNRIVAAADDPLTACPQVSVAALAKRAWVQLSYDTMALDHLDRMFAAAGVAPPQSTVATHSLSLALDLVRNEGFLTSLPEPLLHPRLVSGLSALPVPGYHWSIMTGITYRNSIRTTRPFLRLAQILGEAVREFGPSTEDR